MSYGGYKSDSYARGGYGSGFGSGYDSGYGGSYDKQSTLGSHLHSIDWSKQQLTKFEKNFYIEDKRVSARSEREVQEFRKGKQIIVCLV